MAVTTFSCVFALSVGATGGRIALLGAAVLAGQLSVGWCNDYIDRVRDVASTRSDKPIAVGVVRARVVGSAAVLALAACVVLSAALGVAPGGLHLVAVASAWSYNLGLKATVASPLPYALSFGLLPAFSAATAAGSPAPRPAAVVTGALLGVAAHFANTVRDEEADAATGVRGLPQRLGPRASVGLSAAVVGIASALLLTVLRRTPVTVTSLGAAAALAGVAVLASGSARAARSPVVFRLVMAAAGLVLLAFVLSGSALTLAR